MNAKKVMVSTLMSVVFCGLYAQDKTVQLKSGNQSCTIEVSKITKGENGFPALTIKSTAISGSISMSASDMFPIVACAVLANGDVVNPIPVSGGVVGGSGYSTKSDKPIIKETSANGGGQWKSQGGSGKGYLTFYFATDKPITKIILGIYAEYAKSNYKSFVSAEQAYP